MMDEGQEIASERRSWEAEQEAEAGPRLVPRPAVTQATDYKIKVLGPGEEVGGEVIPPGRQGLLLGEHRTGALLVVGNNLQITAWVEQIRLMILDIPTGSTCVHCLRPIVRYRIGVAWVDEDHDTPSCPGTPEGTGPHRPPEVIAESDV